MALTHMATRMLIVALCVLALACPALAEDDAPGGVGPAPEFTLDTLDGGTLSLSSFRGKVVLLNFWATFCPNCVDDMPKLNALYNKLSPRGLRIIAVSADSSTRRLKGFLEDHPLGFIVLQDDGLTVSHKYHVFSTPTTFLIDKRGDIIEVFFSGQDWTGPEMMGKIERLL